MHHVLCEKQQIFTQLVDIIDKEGYIYSQVRKIDLRIYDYPMKGARSHDE